MGEPMEIDFPVTEPAQMEICSLQEIVFDQVEDMEIDQEYDKVGDKMHVDEDVMDIKYFLTSVGSSNILSEQMKLFGADPSQRKDCLEMRFANQLVETQNRDQKICQLTNQLHQTEFAASYEVSRLQQHFQAIVVDYEKRNRLSENARMQLQTESFGKDQKILSLTDKVEMKSRSVETLTGDLDSASIELASRDMQISILTQEKYGASQKRGELVTELAQLKLSLHQKDIKITEMFFEREKNLQKLQMLGGRISVLSEQNHLLKKELSTEKPNRNQNVVSQHTGRITGSSEMDGGMTHELAASQKQYKNYFQKAISKNDLDFVASIDLPGDTEDLNQNDLKSGKSSVQVVAKLDPNSPTLIHRLDFTDPISLSLFHRPYFTDSISLSLLTDLISLILILLLTVFY